jgi:hypothetical protein
MPETKQLLGLNHGYHDYIFFSEKHYQTVAVLSILLANINHTQTHTIKKENI